MNWFSKNLIEVLPAAVYGLVDESASKSGLPQLSKPFRQAQLAASLAVLLRPSHDS